MQCSIDQNDIEQALGPVGRDVSDKALDGQILPASGGREVPDAIFGNIHADDTVTEPSDEQGIPALPATHVQNPKIFSLKPIEESDELWSRFPQCIRCLAI